MVWYVAEFVRQAAERLAAKNMSDESFLVNKLRTQSMHAHVDLAGATRHHKSSHTCEVLRSLHVSDGRGSACWCWAATSPQSAFEPVSGRPRRDAETNFICRGIMSMQGA